MTAIDKRYDFVVMFDVANGNPNGDPDSGNMPRLDPETNQGLVTDVCLKRKIRNYIQYLDKPGCEIFIQERRPLNPLIAEACSGVGQETYQKPGGGWDTQNAKKRKLDDIRAVQRWLCEKYYDIRAFGGVLSTGPNAGQIRGPIQLTFARSIDSIIPLEISITRLTDVDKEEGEMGRKFIVPYGLYRAHGYVSAHLAGDATKGTGFDQGDLELLWEALISMFEHDRSAARGEMATRGLYVFEHDSALGRAPAHKLFERVRVRPSDDRQAEDRPARAFGDYRVEVDEGGMPEGVRLLRLLE